jgi:hypothetical protein
LGCPLGLWLTRCLRYVQTPSCYDEDMSIE